MAEAVYDAEIVGAGAYVVAVTTVVPSRSVALASSCLADLAREIAATRMRLADLAELLGRDDVRVDVDALRMVADAAAVLPDAFGAARTDR